MSSGKHRDKRWGDCAMFAEVIILREIFENCHRGDPYQIEILIFFKSCIWRIHIIKQFPIAFWTCWLGLLLQKHQKTPKNCRFLDNFRKHGAVAPPLIPMGQTLKTPRINRKKNSFKTVKKWLKIRLNVLISWFTLHGISNSSFSSFCGLIHPRPLLWL